MCIDNEWVISIWSPIHLRAQLQRLYWKPDDLTTGALAFWEDAARYLYLPRLKRREVLEQAIIKGAGSRDFFGTAYGQRDGTFDGFKLGDSNVQLDDTLLLIEPGAALAYAAAHARLDPPTVDPDVLPVVPPVVDPLPPPPLVVTKPRAFHGNVVINAASAAMRLVEVADEIVAVLAGDPNADVTISVEIHVQFPTGATDQIRRAVSENARALKFRSADWE